MNYEKFLLREEIKSIFKVVVFCTIIFAIGAFVVYSNTRFNGFGDIKPFGYYLNIIWGYISNWLKILFKFSGRFLH